MATLDDLIFQTNAQKNVVDQILNLVNDLRTQLAAARAGADLSPVVAAKVDIAFTKSTENSLRLQAVLITPP